MSRSSQTDLTAGETAAVIVTYGDRVHLLEQVLTAVSEISIGTIVVVSNGCAAEVHARIKSLLSSLPGVSELVHLSKNTGSAGGFRAGLEKVKSLARQINFVWLLDDDNRPFRDSFKRLQLAHDYLGRDPDNLLLSLRASRAEYRMAAECLKKVEIRRNSYLGFSLSERLLRPLISKRPPYLSSYAAPIIQIGYAPYGGLLFSKQWLSRIAPPNDKFFLYSDDHEFTLRARAAGGRIYLCAESQLEDLEESWNNIPSPIPPLLKEDADPTRIYHFVRNRSHIEASLRPSAVVHRANMLAFLWWGSLKAVLIERKPHVVLKRLRLILDATREGHRGSFLQDRTTAASDDGI